jgi:cardiolipin synthase
VIVSSGDFGRQVGEMFSEDLAISRRISLEEHEKRGIMVRIMEKMISLLNWFL